MPSDLCGHQETQVEHTLYRFPGLKKLSFCFEKGLSLCVPTVRVFSYLLYLSACLLCLWFLYSYLSVMEILPVFKFFNW